LNAGQSLLDVGCGPGTITADLAGRVARVTAVDTAESVLIQAREAAASQQASNIDFQVADICALPFDDDAFDVVHAHQVLQHVGDPVVALRQLRRVCAPGGVVAARDADYAAMTWYPQLPELDAWRKLYRRVARDNGGEPDAGRRLLSWANAAGFTEVTATATTWCYASAADRAWWSGMWAERIRYSGIAMDALRKGYCAEADLDRLAKAWRDWGGTADGWFVVVHGEILCRN
jgi:ubiquinone/menaquinone biosynthesis C-methylase UbiE